MAKKRNLSLHPACELFPRLGEAELQQLADDIKENGLQNPIVLLDEKILDGRNRNAACKIAKVKPRFVDWDGEGSPVEWVISQNLMRRHLTASQRAVIALDILPMLEEEAKQRQRLSTGRGKKGAQNGASFSSNGKASEIAARITKASGRYVESAKAITKKAPELHDHLRSGGISLTDAKWVAELPSRDRKSLLAKVIDGEIDQAAISQWKATKRTKRRATPNRDAKERLAATTLIHGDCQKKLKDIPDKSVDAIITDPIYPEVNREYGRMSEEDWHSLMQNVVLESQRVLKPTGSAVFILQPNYKKVGQMRLWLWEFMLWAAKDWNLIQDVHWWAVDTLPSSGTNRKQGLLRQSVKMCIWLGSPDCYRNQENVLWETSDKHAARKWSDRAAQKRPSGHSVRDGQAAQVSAIRGGTTPFNLLPIPNANTNGAGGHPASTPMELASWWCRYILPPNSVLLDMFCGSGTMLAAGLDNGASQVIGIEKQKKYLTIAKKRIESA